MKKRVLIIDDEGDLALALALRLRVLGGFEVQMAADGPSGLAKVESFSPDAILLDIAMPGMDGWEVAGRLRADPKTKDLAIVIMTAATSPRLHEQAGAAGARRVVIKPFDEQELVQFLRANQK